MMMYLRLKICAKSIPNFFAFLFLLVHLHFSMIIIFLPEDDVYDEYLSPLQDSNSGQKNALAKVSEISCLVAYHLREKIAILIEEKRGECASPEEEEANAQVEN